MTKGNRMQKVFTVFEQVYSDTKTHELYLNKRVKTQPSVDCI